ncbi:hypothetical protein [Pannonibacter carbonis]|uniref:hypothetical protein n=1 Tax=Pannonibacter carbonis TaxID=2067569 RepID=UPI000D1149F5|nr:hypothetical protein [Pannonibacter carbonis]
MITQQTGHFQSRTAAFGRLWPVAATLQLLAFCMVAETNASSALLPGSTGLLPVSTGVASSTGSCICRAQGIDHELGTTICLRGPKGPRMAQCVMVLNNTSWKFSDAPCALASTAVQPITLDDTGPLNETGTLALSLALWAR